MSAEMSWLLVRLQILVAASIVVGWLAGQHP